jgi:hypothetical protein
VIRSTSPLTANGVVHTFNAICSAASHALSATQAVFGQRRPGCPPPEYNNGALLKALLNDCAKSRRVRYAPCLSPHSLSQQRAISVYVNNHYKPLRSYHECIVMLGAILKCGNSTGSLPRIASTKRETGLEKPEQSCFVVRSFFLPQREEDGGTRSKHFARRHLELRDTEQARRGTRSTAQFLPHKFQSCTPSSLLRPIYGTVCHVGNLLRVPIPKV